MKARYLYRAYKARYRRERMELRAVLSALRPGDMAVDVGANKGVYVYWMRQAVGRAGKVYAYEPQPELAGYLTSVAAAMAWDNVFVGQCAISDVAGRGTLHVPGGGTSPGASLDQTVVAGEPGHRAECRLDTLDKLLGSVGRVALLKVDVEGHELQVFRGGRGLLTRDRPAVLFECEARHLEGHSMEDVFAYLRELGYEGEFFSRRGLRPLREFNRAVHQRQDGRRYWDAGDYCNNFLFKAARR